MSPWRRWGLCPCPEPVEGPWPARAPFPSTRLRTGPGHSRSRCSGSPNHCYVSTGKRLVGRVYINLEGLRKGVVVGREMRHVWQVERRTGHSCHKRGRWIPAPTHRGGRKAAPRRRRGLRRRLPRKHVTRHIEGYSTVALLASWSWQRPNPLAPFPKEEGGIVPLLAGEGQEGEGHTVPAAITIVQRPEAPPAAGGLRGAVIPSPGFAGEESMASWQSCPARAGFPSKGSGHALAEFTLSAAEGLGMTLTADQVRLFRQ